MMNLNGLAPFGVTPSFFVATDPILAVQNDCTDVQTNAVTVPFVELAEQEPIIDSQPDSHNIATDKTNFDHLPEEIKSDMAFQPLLKELELVHQLCHSVSGKMQSILQLLQLDHYSNTEKINWNIKWNSSFSMPLDELPSRYPFCKARNTRETDFRIIRKTRHVSLVIRAIQLFKRLLPDKFSPSIDPVIIRFFNS